MRRKLPSFLKLITDQSILKMLVQLFSILVLSFTISLLLSQKTIDIQQTLDASEITIDFLEAALFIISNNYILLIMIFLGSFLGEWFVYLFCVTNGISLGLIASVIPIKVFIIGTLPHGVLEIGCFLLMGAFAIIKNKDEKRITLKHFSIPFIGVFIASLIEVIVTPQLLMQVI